jgi:hypothetical protein
MHATEGKNDVVVQVCYFNSGFHAALHASHADLPLVTLNILPCTNVTLTLNWITLFIGVMGEGALHRDEVTVKQRN